MKLHQTARGTFLRVPSAVFRFLLFSAREPNTGGRSVRTYGCTSLRAFGPVWLWCKLALLAYLGSDYNFDAGIVVGHETSAFLWCVQKCFC